MASHPAARKHAIWRKVAPTSFVSVFVIDCIAIGYPPPIVIDPTRMGIVIFRIVLSLRSRRLSRVRLRWKRRVYKGDRDAPKQLGFILDSGI